MNPLTSILGTIISGFVLAIIIVFALGTTEFDLWSTTVWLHVLAGVVWIGLLYYFNFVQVPAVATALSEADSGGPGPAAINKYVAPRALLWFRWAAVLRVAARLRFPWPLLALLALFLSALIPLIAFGWFFGALLMDQIREVATGSGYLSQNMRHLEFGLGSATTIDTIHVEWPSGLTGLPSTVTTMSAGSLPAGNRTIRGSSPDFRAMSADRTAASS